MTTNINTDAIAAAVAQAVTAALSGMVVDTPAPKARVKKTTRKAKAKKAQTGVSFKALQLRLREHKAAGHIAQGVTVRNAIAQGLMTDTGDLGTGVGPVKETKRKPAKGGKGKVAKAAKALKAEGPRYLTSKSRQDFVRAHAWAQGLPAEERSTKALAGAVVNGAPLEAGWAVGPRYAEMFGAEGMVTRERQNGLAEALVEPKKAKGGKKKGRKAQRVAAQVEPQVKAKAERAPEPEYGTEAWIAWARPTDDGAPRRADGTATPKSEWAKRMTLAESGLFDAKQIDAALV